jgi:hypothetical protein
MQVKSMKDTSCTCCTTRRVFTQDQLYRVILSVAGGHLVALDQKMIRDSFKNHIDLVSVLPWCE